MTEAAPLAATYILPIRRAHIEEDDDLEDYLAWLATRLEVIVVDGSPEEVFRHHHGLWAPHARHVAPFAEFDAPNGKVAGVNSGLRLASTDRIVIADDDVRYDDEGLRRVVALLDLADVVRPQNYFAPLPWHARWDTARTLLNRAFGGDWPGTLAIRGGIIEAYDGNTMFENLELVRTIEAAGGVHHLARDVYVRRLPPDGRHFWTQRVRQAYDEFARPPLLVAELALLPALAWLAVVRPRALVAVVLGVMGVAEYGRRRDGGKSVFPWTSSLLAPGWVLERAACAWLAVWERVRYGGVRYRGGIVPTAANSLRTLRERRRTALVADGRVPR